MDIVKIKGQARENLGKKASATLRKEGHIPAVIYSKENGVFHFTTTHRDVKQMVFTPDFKLAEIELGGSARKALLKEVTFHPVTDDIVHMDFLELVDGHSIKANIPVQFKGVSPGVKAGGKLIRTLRSVAVKTTPEALVDTLYVSIENLEMGGAIRVRDIEAPEGIEIQVEGAIPVANVEVPRALKAGNDGVESPEGTEEEAEAEA